MRLAFPSLFDRIHGLTSTKKTLLTILGICSLLLLLSSMFRGTNVPQPRHGTTVQPPAGVTGSQQMDKDLRTQWENLKIANKESSVGALPAPSGVVDMMKTGTDYNAPLIAHAAELAMATKEFAKSRTTLEDILDRHHSYAAKLRMVGQPSGSVLTATLRVPSTEFTEVVSDLKTLGNVEREEQTADEVTQRHADLEARLKNAQNTLARLKGMLEQGWKAGDPAAIQRQLAAVSGEIARLDAERMAATRQVTFAQVLFSLQEEIVPPAESFSSQFRAAASMGLGDMLGSLSAILFYVVSRGPAILLWVVLLYFPCRWMWRKWHTNTDRQTRFAECV
jgi:hypothetical protein